MSSKGALLGIPLKLGAKLGSNHSFGLLLGDMGRVERQFVLARWIAIAIVTPLVPFLPEHLTSRPGIFALIAVSALYNAAVQSIGIPRWANHPNLPRFTSVVDVILVAGSVALTGRFDSPLFAAFFLSVISVAFRHGLRGSLLIGVASAGLYAGVVFPGSDVARVLPEYIIRATFVLVVASITGTLSAQAFQSRDRLLEQLRRAETLHRANASVRPSLDLADVSSATIRAAVRLVRGSVGVLVINGESEPDWYIAPGIPHETAAAFAEAAAEFDHLPPDGPVVCRTWPDSPQTSAIGSIAVVRLQGHAGALGRIVIARAASEAPFDAIDVEALEALAQQGGLAVDNAILYRQLGGQLSAVERAQAQVMQAAKLAAIGELAANVAHELNNPLTGVLMHLGLLAEHTSVSPELRSSVQVMEQETIRMRGIVRDLLDFARGSEAQLAPTNIVDVLRSSLALISHRSEMRTIQVRWDIPEDPALVSIDANQFKQVFVNLFGNAIDAMGAEGRLSLRVRAGADWLRVDVSDTGPGIPPERLDRLFDPFFTTKARGVGTGLGLSVSHGIVIKHGGTITCASTVGEGATFSVRIPARAAVAKEAVHGA